MKWLFLMSCLVLVGCGDKSNEQPKANNTPAVASSLSSEIKTAKQITVNQIIQQFKADGLPVGKVQEQTAESDPNHKLGRPNEYIASAQFEDTRIQQVKADPAIGELGLPKGGVIEIFNNDKDLQARKKYIEMAYESMPQAKQYLYVHNNVLLRLEFELTPEQAKAYETSFNRIY